MRDEAEPTDGSRRGSPGGPEMPGGDLRRLIEAERQLRDRIAEAERRAGEIIEAARREAEAVEARLESELEGRIEAVERELGAERREMLEAIERRADRQVEVLENVPAARIESLATRIVRSLYTTRAGGGDGDGET